MGQKDKELLLKDLSSRLPYNVKCAVVGELQPFTLTTIEVDYTNGHLYSFLELRRGFIVQVYTSELKPYLFPLSSMTDEQYKIYHELICGMFSTNVLINYEALTDFFNKNHFDYRGLIPMGLAKDATGLNIY